MFVFLFSFQDEDAVLWVMWPSFRYGAIPRRGGGRERGVSKGKKTVLD